ncbi:ATP-dependent RecD-like DNA helicase [Lachnospiraceae bacterium 45-P1]
MIVCQHEWQNYKNPGNGYTVAVYRTREREKIPMPAIKADQGKWVSFTAVGMELPDLEHVDIELEGTWEDKERFGKQLKVEGFHVLLPKTRQGISSYLSSMVKGIGPVLAEKIVDRFGENTFAVLDKEPERLLEIKGITEARLEAIKESYGESGEIRELMAYLAPYKVTPKKAEKIKEHFGLEAVELIRKNPYRLCEIKGFGFLTVDPIARASAGFSPEAPERVKAADRFVLEEAQKEGHLYLDSGTVIQKAEHLLNKGFGRGRVERSAIIRAGNEMVLKEKSLQADGNAIFLNKNREAEQTAAGNLVRLLRENGNAFDVERELEEVQAELGIVLAERQKEAVHMVFQSQVSIITGGPGKGKTTVLGVILKIFERKEQGKQVLLCAPTGRARKRLSESTGYPALTIHKALYLTGEDEELLEDEILEEDLVIADEFTMADMWLAAVLFSRIKSGARLVLVGDVDQLPSVGPGSVFKELIASGVIPFTVLDVFFRQAKDSRIILNADLINRNQKSLLFGEDFQFHKAEDDKEAAQIIGDLYRKELGNFGGNADMVQVLSPLRVNTEAGVNALNRRLQEIANPGALDKGEWRYGSAVYRVGDKVMQTQNTEEISNGDIGQVTEITVQPDGSREMSVSFGDIARNYQEEELAVLDHAYATSVHKSQGGEYPVVIIPVLKCFYPMLKRNVYYTGVTRAKMRVHLVGSRQALAIAISNTDAGKRNTLLAVRLQKEMERQRLGAVPSAAA